MTKAAALASALLACAHGPPPPVSAPTVARTPAPAAAASTAFRVVRLPAPEELAVVERTPEVTRVVWGGLRAELRGASIAWGDLADADLILEVARDGARWVFLMEGGAVFLSDSFLAPRVRIATAAPLRTASSTPRASAFVGPAVFLDERARLWRVHDGAVLPAALPWPAHVLGRHFTTPRDGVAAVDGPHWLYTHDAGATWQVGRAPASCADWLDDSWRLPLLAVPPDGDELRCAEWEPPPRLAPRLRRRLAFDLADREPAFLPLVEPVVLEAGTLAAFDGTHLRRYDAATWRERDRVPTTWPDDLRVERRLPNGLLGRTANRALRLRADGGSTWFEDGPLFALRADRAEGHAVTALRCDRTWHTLDDAATDLGRPCSFRAAILFGDDAVEHDGTAGGTLRAWSLTPGAVERTLYEATDIDLFEATPDGRWLYAIGRRGSDDAGELAWGDAEAPWSSVSLPGAAWKVAFASPSLAFAADTEGRLWRMSPWDEGWALLPLRVPVTWRDENRRGHLCAGAYCQVTPGVVVVNPSAGVTEEPPPTAPPAPAPSPAASAYACVRGDRVARVGEGAQLSSTGLVWTDDLSTPTRHHADWLGVDARGVFGGRGPITADVAFWEGVVGLVEVSRAGVVAVHSFEVGFARLIEVGATGARARRALPGEFTRPWRRVGACDFSASQPHEMTVDLRPRDARAPIAWHTAAHLVYDAPRWLFARGEVCGVAVERAGEDALAVHDFLRDGLATPRREPRPAFESARPCVTATPPDATRWRTYATDDGSPLRLASEFVDREYESVGETVCLRRAVAALDGSPSRVLAAQPDGTLAGFELDGDTAWSVRCTAP
ncbi:MAG: hypothetical protein U0324_21915 [Polyangiales bacterium]